MFETAGKQMGVVDRALGVPDYDCVWHMHTTEDSPPMFYEFYQIKDKVNSLKTTLARGCLTLRKECRPCKHASLFLHGITWPEWGPEQVPTTSYANPANFARVS